MFSFIHLTDTHFVPAPQKLYALSPHERLAAAIEDINLNFSNAAFAVVTGDLAHRGEEGAYRDLARELSKLEIPCHLVLGNHDDRETFYRVFQDAPRDEHGFLQYVVPTPVGDFLILDSLIGGTDAGELCEERLAWLAARLAERERQPVFVFLHHAPCDIGIPGMDACRLREEAAFGDLLEAHGKVRHIFFGHVHRQICGSWRGIPLSTLPATNHQVLLQFHTARLTPGSHEPPAYAVVRIDGASVVVHTHEYLDRSPRYLLDDAEAEQAQELTALPQLQAEFDRKGVS